MIPLAIACLALTGELQEFYLGEASQQQSGWQGGMEDVPEQYHLVYLH